MVSARDVDRSALVNEAAKALKSKLKEPEWSKYVKTGVCKERAPDNEDWWFVRSASVLRKIYTDGPVGVNSLRVYYGGRHRRGHKPSHFAKGSGKIIRVILQDLEGAGFIKKEKKGRSATSQGQKFLDNIAKNIK